MIDRSHFVALTALIIAIFLVLHMVDKIARGIAACISHEIICPMEAQR